MVGHHPVSIYIISPSGCQLFLGPAGRSARYEISPIIVVQYEILPSRDTRVKFIEFLNAPLFQNTSYEISRTIIVPILDCLSRRKLHCAQKNKPPDSRGAVSPAKELILLLLLLKQQ